MNNYFDFLPEELCLIISDYCDISSFNSLRSFTIWKDIFDKNVIWFRKIKLEMPLLDINILKERNEYKNSHAISYVKGLSDKFFKTRLAYFNKMKRSYKYFMVYQGDCYFMVKKISKYMISQLLKDVEYIYSNYYNNITKVIAFWKIYSDNGYIEMWNKDNHGSSYLNDVLNKEKAIRMYKNYEWGKCLSIYIKYSFEKFINIAVFSRFNW